MSEIAWPAGGEPVEDWPAEQASTPTPAPEPSAPMDLNPTGREAAWVGKDEPASLVDMLLSGATYRQLDYWWRAGLFVKPEDPDPATPGSGHVRRWTGREQQIAALIVRLGSVGIPPSLASRMARDAVDHGARRVTTEEGITISWSGVA